MVVGSVFDEKPQCLQKTTSTWKECNKAKQNNSEMSADRSTAKQGWHVMVIQARNVDRTLKSLQRKTRRYQFFINNKTNCICSQRQHATLWQIKNKKTQTVQQEWIQS